MSRIHESRRAAGAIRITLPNPAGGDPFVIEATITSHNLPTVAPPDPKPAEVKPTDDSQDPQREDTDEGR